MEQKLDKLQQPQPVAAEPETAKKNPFFTAVNALFTLQQAGRLPKDFDLEAACKDNAFAKLLSEFPPEAAVRIYDAEQRAQGATARAKQEAEQTLYRRNALPHTVKGGAATAPTANFRTMTSKEFAALERRFQQEAMENTQRTYQR